LSGVLLGAAWVAVAPINGVAAQKLFAKIGERPFSGRMARMVWQTAPWHATFGGALALSYQLGWDFMRHHAHTETRPRYFDHTIIMTVISVGTTAALGGAPKTMASAAILSLLTLSPMSWWLWHQRRPGHFRKVSNVFYEDDCTPEEIARYQAQDQVEALGHVLSTRPGYGYFTKDARFI